MCMNTRQLDLRKISTRKEVGLMLCAVTDHKSHTKNNNPHEHKTAGPKGRLNWKQVEPTL